MQRTFQLALARGEHGQVSIAGVMLMGSHSLGVIASFLGANPSDLAQPA